MLGTLKGSSSPLSNPLPNVPGPGTQMSSLLAGLGVEQAGVHDEEGSVNPPPRDWEGGRGELKTLEVEMSKVNYSQDD